MLCPLDVGGTGYSLWGFFSFSWLTVRHGSKGGTNFDMHTSVLQRYLFWKIWSMRR